MENFETIESLKWNIHHFERAKYLILQFAKKERHDKHYRLQVGKTVWKCNTFTSLIDCVRMDGEDYTKGHMGGNVFERDFRPGSFIQMQ